MPFCMAGVKPRVKIMQDLMFEGTEKKLELIFSPTQEPLRSKPSLFWQKLCKKAKTRIVSRLSNSFCDSYILSESSLFVWDHRLLMLTCGKTSLAKAACGLLKKFKPSDIEMLFYQRKNEFFPHSQNTSFMQDFEKLQKKIKGQAWRFGMPSSHHFCLFHSEGQSHPEPKDRTIEALMYDVDDSVKKVFFESQSAKQIQNRLGLSSLFKNAELNDYKFKPVGYSLNALMGQNQYFTIHVTPQEPGFYISFETNAQEESVNNIVNKLLALFKPFSFDVIVFLPNNWPEENYFSESFYRSTYAMRRLNCGYKVSFASFVKPLNLPRPAVELTL